MSAATRKRNMAALENAGYIQRSCYGGAPGRSGGKTNRYFATVPVGATATKPMPPPDASSPPPVCMTENDDAPRLTGSHGPETGSSATQDWLADEPRTLTNHHPNPHPSLADTPVHADWVRPSVWVVQALQRAGCANAASELSAQSQLDQLDRALTHKLHGGGWTAFALADHVVHQWPAKVSSPIGLLRKRIRTAPKEDPSQAEAGARARNQVELQRRADQAEAAYKKDHERLEPARRALERMSDAEIKTVLLPRLGPTLRALDLCELRTLEVLEVMIAADMGLLAAI